jgi:hypothetical protein
MATEMDCLVLGNYLLLKGMQPTGAVEDAEAYKARFMPD